ncbi:unnamed protein product [Trichobilharzia regenti]|nr:unnamed protein product [Trichobilharzia regenti]
MTLDVAELKSRLHKQSELIMILKSRADSEMENRKLAECKLLSELKRNQDLKEQLVQYQQNRVLRSNLDSLSFELLCQTSAKKLGHHLTDACIQAEPVKTFQDKSISTQRNDEECLDVYRDKFRRLSEKSNELSGLINQAKSFYLKNQKTLQISLEGLIGLITKKDNIHLRTSKDYHDHCVKWENERKTLTSQLEDERILNNDMRMKLNEAYADKSKLEDTLKKLKEQREREMKEFNANVRVKCLEEELMNSKLEMEQMKKIISGSI